MQPVHLYLSLIPQALLASMLPPEDFGNYYAVGPKRHSHGEAIFFEVDPEFRSDDFPFDIIAEKCVPGPGGEPKASVYLGIYRVLSRIPVAALGDLFLVTSDGLTLRLQRGEYREPSGDRLHLYQEHCPITPAVASRLSPAEFCRFITDPAQPVHVPRIVFSELALRELSQDPAQGAAGDLPYDDMEHLRECLLELGQSGKETKMVRKQVGDEVVYRLIEGGFYVGDRQDFAYYRFPSEEELDRDHRSWWRSAQHVPIRRV